MMRFLKPRHLRYGSIEEWMEREHITTFNHPENPALQDRLFEQLGELRKHLYDQHLRLLTPEECRQLKAGQHPSQSHARAEQAKPIFEEFRSRMKCLPFIADVLMCMYHMDRIVFRVKLTDDAGQHRWRKEMPPFYRGFEVGVWTKSTEQGSSSKSSQPFHSE